MIKFTAALTDGNLYGFGLSEGNLNRLEFNEEIIFFDFGYAGHPKLFGLIVYLPHYPTALDMLGDIDRLKATALSVASGISNGVTPETLRVFPLACEVMQKFRSTPFWGFDTSVPIAEPGDRQMFFSARTEQEIEDYLRKAKLIGPATKRSTRGFGMPRG